MFAIQINRDDVLVEECLIEEVFSALPQSFRYRADISPLRRGRVFAINGHSEVSLQMINGSLWLFVTPRDTGNLAIYASFRTYQKVSTTLREITLNYAVPA